MIGLVDHAGGEPQHALLDAFERGELGHFVRLDLK
jgi:hypothetical protein